MGSGRRLILVAAVAVGSFFGACAKKKEAAKSLRSATKTAAPSGPTGSSGSTGIGSQGTVTAFASADFLVKASGFDAKSTFAVASVRDTSMFGTDVGVPLSETKRIEVTRAPEATGTTLNYHVEFTVSSTGADGNAIDRERLVIMVLVPGSSVPVEIRNPDVIVNADGSLSVGAALGFAAAQAAVFFTNEPSVAASGSTSGAGTTSGNGTGASDTSGEASDAGNGSDPVAPAPPAPPVPTVPPAAPSGLFAIKGGDAATASTTVTLDLTDSARVLEYRAANGVSCAAASWQIYGGGAIAFELTATEGTRTVCLEVRGAGGADAVRTDTILLDTHVDAPTNPRIAADASGGATATSDDDLEIFFTWTAATDVGGAGIRDYTVIAYDAAACGGTPVETAGITQTFLAYTGVNRKTYSFRVKSFDQLGNEATSATCSGNLRLSAIGTPPLLVRADAASNTASNSAAQEHVRLDSGDGLTAGSRLVFYQANFGADQGGGLQIQVAFRRNGADVGKISTMSLQESDAGFLTGYWDFATNRPGTDHYSIEFTGVGDDATMKNGRIFAVDFSDLAQGTDYLLSTPADVANITAPSGEWQLGLATVEIPAGNLGRHWVIMSRGTVMSIDNNDAGSLAYRIVGGGPDEIVEVAQGFAMAGNASGIIATLQTLEVTSDLATTIRLDYRYTVVSGSQGGLAKIALLAFDADALTNDHGGSRSSSTVTATSSTPTNHPVSTSLDLAAAGRYLVISSSVVNATTSVFMRMPLKLNGATVSEHFPFGPVNVATNVFMVAEYAAAAAESLSVGYSVANPGQLGTHTLGPVSFIALRLLP